LYVRSIGPPEIKGRGEAWRRLNGKRRKRSHSSKTENFQLEGRKNNGNNPYSPLKIGVLSILDGGMRWGKSAVAGDEALSAILRVYL